MEFGILGPLRVLADGGEVAAGRRRERCLLGVLLMHPGQAIPAERLIELLWEGQDRPAQAQRTLRTHVARLRGVFGRLPVREQPRLLTAGSGYSLQVAPEAVDAYRFRAMVGTARSEPSVAGRRKLLADALALWRGPVLDGTLSVALRERLCRDLEELRLTAIEDHAAAELDLGGHRELVGELATLVGEHPERELLLALYMRALDRCGRTSDALRAFDARRRWLADHEGLDPGQELRAAHAAILRGENTPPEPPPAVIAAPPEPPAGPAQLPAQPAFFVGRRDALDRLDAAAARHPPTPVLITGMGGIGKTALALRWAHRALAEYPDAQLYHDLRGHDWDAPVPTLRVVSAFLRALGVAPSRVPGTLDEASALYRTMTAGRRVLVLLDNVAGADQVRALLPGGSTAMTLVTSRHRMPGLVARDGASLVELDALPSDEAVGLLAAVVGGDRVGREPVTAAALAAACGHLPLALRIVGAELAAHPGMTLSQQLANLRAGGRLSRLTPDGDVRSAVRSLVDRSHQRLAPATARMFRLLAAAPLLDFDADTAAAVAGVGRADAVPLLGHLVGAHMLTEGGGRFAFHDLVREYGQELAGSGPAGETAEATDRLSAYLRARVDAAAAMIDPNALRLPRDEALSPGRTPPWSEVGQARAWLDRELANIVAVITHAAGTAQPTAWLLADGLRRHMFQQGNAIDALAVAGPALRAAEAAGDGAATAAMLLSTAQAEEHAGEYREAMDLAVRSADTAREAGWRRGEAAALANLGEISIALGRLKDTAGYFEAALTLFRDVGDVNGEANCRNGLGGTALQLGRPDEAAEHYREALRLYREASSAGGAAVALSNLGEVELDRGRVAEAVRYHDEALTLYRLNGRADGTAFSLVRLAAAHLEAGRSDEALRCAVEGLDVVDRTDLPYRRVSALSALGAVARVRGDLPLALRYHEEAVHLARELGLRYLVADALVSRGQAGLDAGRPEEAAAAADEAVRLADNEDYRLLASQGRTLRAQAALAVGDRRTACEYAEQALAIATAGGFRLAGALALEVLGRAGPPEQAERSLTAAWHTLSELGSAAAGRVRAALDAVHA
ncbi:AfsR/SARP family transcriptional regulator [Couchioplanes azureus]|uniref:AfsR/SARP family transcriptional regulator n=1 Tax=Couchioplanes caeruleus TaxID=56438 RepID=UPI00166F6CA5|nr:tetratricopeptide repeat protein [Couchioplanes caeruleus]